jgi:hypothetical protein
MNSSADETYAKQQIGLTLYFTHNMGKFNSSFIWYFSHVFSTNCYKIAMFENHAIILGPQFIWNISIETL